MKRKALYIETFIHSSLDTLWQYTQQPDMHQRWDLRFSEISYLPKTSDTQQFLYRTRIGGISVSGKGASLATRIKASGTNISILRFWSDARLSLIRTGSGYWKYIPQEQGVRFITAYDYQTRFGWLGSLADRFFFRPLMRYATALSFDSLRLWIEKGIDPSASYSRYFIHHTIRFFMAFIWLFQGLIPKILFPDATEKAILLHSSFWGGIADELTLGMGIAEILWGILFLLGWRLRSLYKLNILLLIILGAGALWLQPGLALKAFTPLNFNTALICLSLTGLWNDKNIPAAAHCKTQKPGV